MQILLTQVHASISSESQLNEILQIAYFLYRSKKNPSKQVYNNKSVTVFESIGTQFMRGEYRDDHDFLKQQNFSVQSSAESHRQNGL